ncbi:hypothetical protein B0F90DRAFT_1897159, partial [Multifurca ochricompacta]
MDSDRSSRLAQDVEIPTSMHSNIGDTETPGLKNDLEDFIPDAIKIEPSFEESEERAEEDSATQSAESDDGEGLQDVPLGNSKVNATGAVNEHAAPSDHIPDHDSSEQQPKPAVPTALSVGAPYTHPYKFDSRISRLPIPSFNVSSLMFLHLPLHRPFQKKTTIHSVPSASPRESLPRLQPNGAHSVVSPSLSTNSLPSASSPSGAAHRRSLTIPKGNPVSSVLITSALETIAASREAKKSAPLRECAHRALELVRADLAGDQPHEIFEPLRLACETRSEKLMIASLDCITKLISHSFFIDDSSPHLASLPSPPPSPGPGRRDSNSSIPEPSLVDLVVHTITSCHTETSPDAVSLQVVRALLALVLSSTILVHQSSLLKATVAQGSLTQMVNQVFARCKIGLPYGNTDHEGVTFVGTSTNSSRRASIAPSTPDSVPASSLPLDDNAAGTPASRNSSEGETLATSASQEERSEQGSPGYKSPEALEAPLRTRSPEHEGLHLNGSTNHGPLTTKDLFIKDAFLVFRAMCKLTMKPLNTESERDLKSHAMRSKLLSLHMVLIILSSHMDVFVSSTSIIYSSSSHEANSFIQMANQYLCLCLSRNAVSPVPQVFEISVEIFWRTLSGLRTKLKKEIEVLFHEIFIPILEMKTSTLKQKSVILSMISRLCQDPQAIVDIYINYDCDSQATDNIYEHLVNVITKLSSSTYSGVAGQKNVEPAGTAPPPPAKPQNMSLAPSLSTTALGNPSAVDPTTLGQSEAQLRRQGLECLVSVLRSLVAWGTGKCAPSEDSGNNAATPDASVSLDRLPLPDVARGPTPDIADDPSRFESAKQKKTTLMEGIKRFNQKPKKVHSIVGIQFLVETGFIQSQGPQDVARFLLNTEGLSKAMIGEYLGEGDEVNVATMHAFVDMIDLRNTGFVDALRAFLQAFRLPGEAQKIDRFMLKFAERYIEGNTQTPFANADAAYVLSYSTIMLNTDAHNPQVKHRMTKNDFIKNNRGVNDSADLPEEFLSNIYDDIVSNEIRMKDEMDAVLGQIP